MKLHQLTVSDRVAGGEGYSYTSPPQPLEALQPLAAILLGRADTTGGLEGHHERAIAGGRRVLDLHALPETQLALLDAEEAAV